LVYYVRYNLPKDVKEPSFLESLLEDEAMVAQLSYWEKWLTQDQRQLVESIIEAKKEAYPGKSESLPLNLEKKFTDEELRLIFSNIVTIQLTFGCSKGCPFCGVDAVKGVREHIPYAQLANMFKKYGNELRKGQPFLYWASEPSDYASREGIEDRTYEDVHQLAMQYAQYDPDITSFNIFDQKWIDFMATSRERFQGRGPERRLSTYGLKDETRNRVRGMVEESFEKAIKHRNPESPHINLVERTPGELVHLEGMGTSFKTTNETSGLTAGITCVDGVLLTPRGIYNLVVVPLSKEYPQGAIIMPIDDIADINIKAGDSLKDVMRNTIVEAENSHEDEYVRGEPFKRYTGSFPKKVFLNTPSAQYQVLIDKDGHVVESQKIERLAQHRKESKNN